MMWTIDRVAASYPKFYHMADVGSWPSIQRHGLLSTSALLDLFGTEGPARTAIESKWRPTSVHLKHEALGNAVIRDQAPMPENLLAPLLRGVSTREWYELI